MIDPKSYPFVKRRELIKTLCEETTSIIALKEENPVTCYRILSTHAFSVLNAITSCMVNDLSEYSALKGINFSEDKPFTKVIMSVRLKGGDRILMQNHSAESIIKAIRQYILWLKETRSHIELPYFLKELPEGFKVAKSFRDNVAHPSDPDRFIPTPNEIEATCNLLRWCTDACYYITSDSYLLYPSLVLGGLSKEVALSLGWPLKDIMRDPSNDQKPKLPDWKPRD